MRAICPIGRPRAADVGAVLTYRYLRPGYKLTLAAQRFEEAEVLQALVDSVQLTTVVSEDGQMMTEMSLAVRNNARQHLEVMLPGRRTGLVGVRGGPARATEQARRQTAVADGAVGRRRDGAGGVDLRRRGQVPARAWHGRDCIARSGCAAEERALGIVPASGLSVRAF